MLCDVFHAIMLMQDARHDVLGDATMEQEQWAQPSVPAP